jgi:hypothetical protein
MIIGPAIMATAGDREGVWLDMDTAGAQDGASQPGDRGWEDAGLKSAPVRPKELHQVRRDSGAHTHSSRSERNFKNSFRLAGPLNEDVAQSL